jgi:hypothetical protein
MRWRDLQPNLRCFTTTDFVSRMPADRDRRTIGVFAVQGFLW